jgi:hypothetical protein
MTVIMRSDKIVRPKRGRTTLRPFVSVFGHTRSTGSDTSLVGLGAENGRATGEVAAFLDFGCV